MFAFLLNELQHLGQKYLWTWSGWFDHVDCLDGSFAYPAKDKQITGRVSKRLPTRCSESFRGFAQHRERDFSHFRHFSFVFFFSFSPLFTILRFLFFFFSSSPFERRPLSERTRPFVETFDQIVGEINDEHEFILRKMIRKGEKGEKKRKKEHNYKVSRCC